MINALTSTLPPVRRSCQLRGVDADKYRIANGGEYIARIDLTDNPALAPYFAFNFSA